MKFGMQIHLRNVLKSKPEVNSAWWRWPYWISVADHPILTKFGVPTQILTPPSKINPKLEFFEIQDGGRKPSSKYTKRHNFPKYWLICTKFGMRMHFVFIILKMYQNEKPEINSTRRRRPYWISVLSQYLGRWSSDFDQIWCANAYFDSALENLSKIWIFQNSKWRTEAILKIYETS